MSKITFRLGTDNSDFKKGLADAQADAEKASGPISKAFGQIKHFAAGLIAFEAIKEGFRSALESASQLAHMSENLSVSTDSLQALGFVARQNGVEMQQLQKAMEAVTIKTSDLIDGNEQATAAFGKLGLRAKDFIGLGADERIAVLAKAFVEAKDRGEAFAAVADILGAKVGPKLMGALQEIGERGLPGVTEAAREAGQVIDKEVIASLEKFDRRMEIAGQRSKRILADVVDRVAMTIRMFQIGTAATAQEIGDEESKRRTREEAQKRLSEIAERKRAEAAAEAARKKAAEKRDVEEKKRLDEYIRLKRANEEESAKQVLDSMTPEQRLAALAKERLQLEREMTALPRNQIDSETRREQIKKRILEITKDEKQTQEKITEEQKKQKEKLQEIDKKIAEQNKKVSKAKEDVINAKYDPFRFTIADAAAGKRGSPRSRQNVSLITQKERQAQNILDRNNLEYDENGVLRYIPAPGESAQSIRQHEEYARKVAGPRLNSLIGGAAGLRRSTANLDRKEQDPTKAQREALKDALDESKNLAAIRDAVKGKFKNQ